VASAFSSSTPATVIILYPKEPYVCIGFHQVLEKDVDLSACRRLKIPVLRREVGGGAVYLDSDQLFFQLVFPIEQVPPRISDIYSLFLEAPARTYQRLGIPAFFRPTNDILVGERKISGAGVAILERAVVVVGNIIFDFDYDVMSRVLNVPSEKFRDKVYHTLRQYVTSIKRELGRMFPREEVKKILIEEFQKVLGYRLEDGELSAREKDEIEMMDKKFQTPEWIAQKRVRHRNALKITTGIEIAESMLKTPGGLIRATLTTKKGYIEDLTLSGDFTISPIDSLNRMEGLLIGKDVRTSIWERDLERFYEEYVLDSPGLKAQDFILAIKKAANQ